MVKHFAAGRYGKIRHNSALMVLKYGSQPQVTRYFRHLRGPQDVYVLQNAALQHFVVRTILAGRSLTVLPCTLWAALSFEFHSQTRADVALSRHRAIPAPANDWSFDRHLGSLRATPSPHGKVGDFSSPPLIPHRPKGISWPLGTLDQPCADWMP